MRMSSRVKTVVGLGSLMFAPSGVLLWHGNLTVDDALVRLGGAGAFALVGTALVAATLDRRPRRVAVPVARPSGDASSAASDSSGSVS